MQPCITLLVFLSGLLLASSSSTNLLRGYPTRTNTTSGQKVAFTFLTRAHIPLEPIWQEFFTWRADPSEYSIYVHPRPGYSFPSTSLFYGKEIKERVEVKYLGGDTMSRGILNLVKAALQDPSNTWINVISDSCIPLLPFSQWKSLLFQSTKSYLNACPISDSESHMYRWDNLLLDLGMRKKYWRKSSSWLAMTRKHALVYVAEMEKNLAAWGPILANDEHVVASSLAMKGLDNETACNDGFTFVKFLPWLGSHPYTYSGLEVSPSLFSTELSTPLGKGERGFAKECTGIPGVCHFIARKFSPQSLFSLLDHMKYMLDEKVIGLPEADTLPVSLRIGSEYGGWEQTPGAINVSVPVPYTRDPWIRLKPLLRVSRSTGQYFLIEDGKLRPFSNPASLQAFHLQPSDATSLTVIEKLQLEVWDTPFPWYSENQLLRCVGEGCGEEGSIDEEHGIFIFQAGRRHPVINWVTRMSFRLEKHSVLALEAKVMELIPLGGVIDASSKLTAKS